MAGGTEVRTRSGARLRYDALIEAGGQGRTFRAVNLSTGEPGVFKVFNDTSAESAARAEYLSGQRLDTLCPALCAPREWVAEGGTVGHFSALAPGRLLESFLEAPDYDLVQGLQLAAALAHAVAVLHARGMAHGDIQARNVFVNPVGRVLEVYLIDFDNFVAAGVPRATFAGQPLYLAPELYEGAGVPGVETDLFSLGVLMSEILLWRHPASGMDDDPGRFAAAMYGGRWLHDPANPGRPRAAVGGYPSEVLNATLGSLFRRVFDRDSAQRPGAAAWETALCDALFLVDRCSACGAPSIIDTSKTRCPLCGTAYPVLALWTASGRSVRLNAASTVVGRAQLGGGQAVSERHAVFRRSGPDVYVRSEGGNGTFRLAAGRWARLPQEREVLVRAGDQLRFADVDAEVRLGA